MYKIFCQLLDWCFESVRWPENLSKSCNCIVRDFMGDGQD